MTPENRGALADTGFTLLVGGCGAVFFWLVGFPAAVLTGSAFAVSVAALMGTRMSIPVPLREICFLVIGLSIGTSVTPEVIASAAKWPISLSILAITLVISIICAQTLAIKLFRFDRISGFLAAAPGHLSYVLSLSVNTNADIPRITIAQSIRVLLLTLLVPVLITLWSAGDGQVMLHEKQAIAFHHLVLLIPLAGLGGYAFRKLKIPAPTLLSGILISGVGHALDLTPGTLPTPLTLAAFLVMGSLIGTRFVGTRFEVLKSALLAGLCMTLLTCAISTLGAVFAAQILKLDPAILLLAFAPGGVEIMAALSIELDLEPALVAAHHIFRLLILTLLIPIFLSVSTRKNNGA